MNITLSEHTNTYLSSWDQTDKNKENRKGTLHLYIKKHHKKYSVHNLLNVNLIRNENFQHYKLHPPVGAYTFHYLHTNSVLNAMLLTLSRSDAKLYFLISIVKIPYL